MQQMDYEKLLMTNPDLLIKSNYSDDFDFDEKLRNTEITTLLFSDWKETNPLGRAEWIKVLGLFVQKEARADSIFKEIEKNYIALRDSVKFITSKKSVLLGAPYKDVWYMPSGDSYKAKLLSDAGVNYKWKDEKGSGSLALSLESVIKEQAESDVWIESPYKTYANLMAQDSRYKIFKAFKQKEVYHYKKQIRPDGANNYWERGVGRPDELLGDLIGVFYKNNDGALKYYQRLK